ncbi:MAG: cation diffusion facilitator family transporter [Candidatus Omnitrophota bacterium]|jgi:cation diffusion facilitator family transporter|nr:cation diffusion facilitator family transporter [Candidatus Omnitrophota bacterium]
MPEATNGKIVDCRNQQFLAARISIAGSIILFLISATVGIAVDSITLILDASASLVILAAAFLMNYAVKKIHQPPDDSYNFGYHKYEPLTAAIQSGLIIATCVVSIKFALQDIVHAEDTHSYSLPAIATFFAGLLGLFVTTYLKKIQRKVDSQMLRAAAQHWFIDTVLSFSVCLGFCFGLVMQSLGYTAITPYVDPVMAIMLAVFFISMPVRGGLRNLFELLDAAPLEEGFAGKVKEVVEEYKPRSFGVHRLRIRKAGQRIFVDICFLVKENLTVSQVEELAENFERDLNLKLPGCDVVVYFRSK